MFIYNNTFHRRKNHFCRYSLHIFSTKEILKCHIRDYFKINGKQKFIMRKKTNMLYSKIKKEK